MKNFVFFFFVIVCIFSVSICSSMDTVGPSDPSFLERCTEGQSRKLDCNTCFCSNGQWACTMMGCPPKQNKFVCDCRLAWLHTLRNETKNPQIRNTLDEITCSMEAAGQSSPRATLPPPPSAPRAVDNQFPENADDYKDDYDPAEYDNDNDIYDQQQDSSLNYVTASGPKDSRKRHLFEIPPQELPCPQEEHPTEAPRTLLHTPGYAGINASGAARLLGAALLLALPLSLT